MATGPVGCQWDSESSQNYVLGVQKLRRYGAGVFAGTYFRRWSICRNLFPDIYRTRSLWSSTQSRLPIPNAAGKKPHTQKKKKKKNTKGLLSGLFLTLPPSSRKTPPPPPPQKKNNNNNNQQQKTTTQNQGSRLDSSSAFRNLKKHTLFSEWLTRCAPCFIYLNYYDFLHFSPPLVLLSFYYLYLLQRTEHSS